MLGFKGLKICTLMFSLILQSMGIAVIHYIPCTNPSLY